jgi:hypothetical protein
MLAVAIAFTVALIAWYLSSKPSSAPPSIEPTRREPPSSHRSGRAPHPAARLVELPSGIRIVDLRWLPRRDLAVANVSVALEQVRLERPVAVQIWVIDAETATVWDGLSETAVVVVAGHLRDPRVACKNVLYVHGATLSREAQDRFARAGVETVIALTNLSGTPTSLDEHLETAQPWTESSEDRPVFDQDTFRAFDGLRLISGVAFVDVRRAHPESLASGEAVDRIAEAVATVPTLAGISHVVWVFAPWTLERLGASGIDRIAACATSLPASLPQRLAIAAAPGEPVAADALVKSLGGRASPLREQIMARTAHRGVFDVAMLDALHDAYFWNAWKHPRP